MTSDYEVTEELARVLFESSHERLRQRFIAGGVTPNPFDIEERWLVERESWIESATPLLPTVRRLQGEALEEGVYLGLGVRDIPPNPYRTPDEKAGE